MQYMGQGLPIALIGYVMVFIVLAILWGAIEIMRMVLSSKNPKAEVQVKSAEPVEIPKPIEKEQVDEGELIAVLTAAIAASLNTSTYNLKIKSYKRIDTINNAWSNASRNDAINNY